MLTRPHPAATASRAGLSLPELLVALSVLTLGLLALAGVTAGVTRAAVAAARATRAATLLDARSETLRAAACDTGSGTSAGTVDADGVTERWTIAAADGLLALADTVSYGLPGRAPRSLGAHTWRWCAR